MEEEKKRRGQRKERQKENRRKSKTPTGDEILHIMWKRVGLKIRIKVSQV